MLIRTVFDSRATSPKYVHHMALLAASWHRHIRDRNERRLEVVTIGRAAAHLRGFLETIGVRIVEAPPDLNDSVSRTSNTIVGALAEVGNERVLLLDNDIAFLREPSWLDVVPDDTLGGTVAGHERVSPRQWRIIEDELKLSPLGRGWVSFQQERRALLEGGDVPPEIPLLYVNAGVLLMPRGSEFPLLWRRHVALIARLFEHRAERSPGVHGSCQAGLATAIGAWGKFALLPLSHNFRPACFVLGKCRADEVSILHMSSGYEMASDLSTSDRLREYWKTMIADPIESVRTRLTPTEYEERSESARTCLRELTRLCDEYRLDETVRRCVTSG